MAYTTNPNLPKVRMEAVRLVKYNGWSTRKVARHTGFSQSTIVKWCKKDTTGGWRQIPTLSSRPHSHPKALKPDIEEAIMKQRRKHNRCAEVVHQELMNISIKVSLSSVKRTLDRMGMTKKRSPWKHRHDSTPRPIVQRVGDLIQIDTIHRGPHHPGRLYVYTLLDVYSRWAWAEVVFRISASRSITFVKRVKQKAPFNFLVLQSDHGSEFSTWFTKHIGIRHRHIRVRTPNDNAHLERFNRTLQEECLSRTPETLKAFKKSIPEYLHYYNTERLHMGINLKTPIQMIPRY